MQSGLWGVSALFGGGANRRGWGHWGIRLDASVASQALREKPERSPERTEGDSPEHCRAPPDASPVAGVLSHLGCHGGWGDKTRPGPWRGSLSRPQASARPTPGGCVRSVRD